MSLRPDRQAAERIVVRQDGTRPLHTDAETRFGPFVPEGGTLPGTALGPGAKLFHDATDPALSLTATQTGLVLETGAFDGTFLSVALDLPPQILMGLTQAHVLQLRLRLAADPPGLTYARLNLQTGAVTEARIVAVSAPAVDFDLVGAWPGDTAPAHAWIDIIFETPAHRHLRLEDLQLYRFLGPSL